MHLELFWGLPFELSENALCVLERNIYCAAVGWDTLYVCWFHLVYSEFKSCFSLIDFCLDDLSIVESRTLKCPHIIILLSIFSL